MSWEVVPYAGRASFTLCHGIIYTHSWCLPEAARRRIQTIKLLLHTYNNSYMMNHRATRSLFKFYFFSIFLIFLVCVWYILLQKIYKTYVFQICIRIYNMFVQWYLLKQYFFFKNMCARNVMYISRLSSLYVNVCRNFRQPPTTFPT